MLAWIGLRLGKLLVLKWTDIDYNKATISIAKILYNSNINTIKYEITTPKTKGSIRVIDIAYCVTKKLHFFIS